MQVNASYAMRESGGEERQREMQTAVQTASRAPSKDLLDWVPRRRAFHDGEAIVTLTAAQLEQPRILRQSCGRVVSDLASQEPEPRKTRGHLTENTRCLCSVLLQGSGCMEIIERAYLWKQ